MPAALTKFHCQVRAAAERWCLRNGVASVDDVRFGPQTRLWIDAIATLQGDEKREILFSTVLSPTTCTDVPGFEAAAGGLLPVTGGALPISDQTLERMVGICSERAVELAAGFRASMTRRFERDRERIESYFRELTDELDRRVARGKVDASAALDKRAALRGDRAAKLEALAARFVLRIETSPVALRIVQVDGAFATLSLRRRKSARRLELEFDAVTKRIVPPACENCHRAALKPAACDDAMHLLCERCIPRAEGRIACPACHKDHAGCARRAGEAQPSHAG